CCMRCSSARRLLTASQSRILWPFRFALMFSTKHFGQKPTSQQIASFGAAINVPACAKMSRKYAVQFLYSTVIVSSCPQAYFVMIVFGSGFDLGDLILISSASSDGITSHGTP